MSKSFKREDLMQLFTKPQQQRPIVVAPIAEVDDVKENSMQLNEKDGYRRSNQSLVQRNSSMKVEMTVAQKRMNDLRAENESLREKIRILESSTDEEKIEIIVAERLQKKLAQINSITDRTIQYLTKSANDFVAALGNMGTNTEPVPVISLPTSKAVKSRPKSLAVAAPPSLRKVDESPLVRLSTIRRRATASKNNSPDPDATPKVVSKAKSRRSGAVLPINEPLDSDNDELNDTIVEVEQQAPIPLATPMQRRINHANELGETPGFGDTDTVRRKRSAASKVASYAQPSLHSKLRRPGKFDEPSPFVSSMY